MDIAGIAFKTTKFQSDPTASGVPLLAANPEQGLFKELNKYRFDDQTRLDYRGMPSFRCLAAREPWVTRTSAAARDL